jgi:cytoskeletal protein CcmA (bactofilin family)
MKFSSMADRSIRPVSWRLHAMFGKSNKPAPDVRAAKASNPSVPSIISASLSIKGDIVCEGDIQLDGRVEGVIRTKSLTIGATGEVRGEITAERVRVLGKVFGPIRAKSIDLGRSAQVVGDIRYETLTVEQEAQVDGHIQRIEDAAGTGREAAPLALVHDLGKK